jgi:hypothetical protein
VNRRGNALRVGMVAAAAWLGGSGLAVVSASAAPQGTISLSTTTIVPGQYFTVTGADWSAGTTLVAYVCGHNGATSEDCASTNFGELQASPKGAISARMLGVVPPHPCPCVVLVKGVNVQFTESIEVTVLTGPIPAPPNEPDLRIQDLRVVAKSTGASAMGAAAPRTVELRLHNAGPFTETPVVIGRWGHPTQVDHSITMPKMGSLAPGATKSVRADFSLPALSVGAYTVQVTAQVGGFGSETNATAPTTQYPIGLFALLAFLLLTVLLLLVTGPSRRRRRARRRPPSPPQLEERRLVSSAESEARSEALSRR